MAGSLKWFSYVADGGISYGAFLDESNTEALNGGAANTPLIGTGPTVQVPRGLRKRYAVYASADGARVVKITVLNATIYNALPAALQTITPQFVYPAGLPGAGNLVYQYKRPEIVKQPKFGIDTGLTDGDTP
jgi:hypothetical protein